MGVEALPLLTGAELFGTPIGGFCPPASADTNGVYFDFGPKHDLAFNPATGGIFAANRFNQVAEWLPPALVLSANIADYNYATYLQPHTPDATEGKDNQVDLGGSEPANTSAVLVYDGELLASLSINYDNANSGLAWYRRPLSTSALGDVVGIDGLINAAYFRYFNKAVCLIPPEWQASLGGTVMGLGGNSFSIVSTQSDGPSAASFTPSSITGAHAQIAGNFLLGYPPGHKTLGNWLDWPPPSPFYNFSAQVLGGFIPDGTRNLVFVGTMGSSTSPYAGYGIGTSDITQHGVPEPDPVTGPFIYCYDPVYAGNSGGHCWPYRPVAWVYDLLDLAAVYAGTKNPWDVMPVELYYLDNAFPIPLTDPAVARQARGAAWDPETRRVYISEEGAGCIGNNGCIQVFEVPAGGVVDESPSAPAMSPPSTVTGGATPSLAGVIPSLPFEVTMDPGVPYVGLWYKYTPTANDVLSIYGCNALPRDVDVEVWTGNDPAALTYKTTQASKQPLEWPIILGTDIYFYLYTNDYVGGDELTLSIEAASAYNTAIQVGDLFISEDEGHGGNNLYDPTLPGFYPSIWYGEDGTLRYIDATLPATELGACLHSGRWALVDRTNAKIHIYNPVPGVSEIGQFAIPAAALNGFELVSLATDFDFFYLLHAPNGTDPLKVYKVTEDGVITGPVANLAHFSDCLALASGGAATSGLSRDGSILYYPESGFGIFGGRIFRHDMLTDTPLASWAAPDPLDVLGDILVLSDNTVVAMYIYNSGVITSTNKIVHYAASGTILQSWTIDAYPYEAHHISIGGDDSAASIWILTQHLYTSPFTPANISGYNRYQRIRLADGVAINDFTKGNFLHGVGPYDDGGTCDSARFGAPPSCPLMAMMAVGEPPPPEPEPEPPADTCAGGGLALSEGTGGDGCTTC